MPLRVERPKDLMMSLGVLPCRSALSKNVLILTLKLWKMVEKSHHFSSVDVAPWKRSYTFLYRIYPKENIVYTGVLQIFHTQNR
jgi:hypothetical protein